MTKSKGTALVTGASAGIGLELARCFARGNWDLVLVARREEKLRQLAAELEERHGIAAQVLVEDLSDPSSISRIVQVLDEKQIGVDVLVNNAGFAQYGPFAASDAATMQQVLGVNIVALTMLSRALLPAMIEASRRDGRKRRILNVGSVAGFLPGPLMAVYYASKAYVLSLSESMAAELDGHNISVTCLCPGPTPSEFQSVAKMDLSSLSKSVLTSADMVAREGYRSCMRGQVLVIPGASNKIGAFVPRLLPRRMLSRLVRRVQERR
jgi:short-subunit dehydrogenase